MPTPAHHHGLVQAAPTAEVTCHVDDRRDRQSHPCCGTTSTHDDYAFHLGGKSELQFNIGFETVNGRVEFREGVAFSLETSQALPSIQPLLPKIARFNAFVREHAEDFAGFVMWHVGPSDVRSMDEPVGPIPDSLLVEDTFIALGRRFSLAEIHANGVLSDFDWLLPLYLYVEDTESPRDEPGSTGFQPGCPAYPRETSVSLPARTVDVALRHKRLQPFMHSALCRESGAQDVRTEHRISSRMQSDAAVRGGSGLALDELKIAPDARTCLRLAMGQLLEYGFWPESLRASELVVVGEPEADSETSRDLNSPRQQFGLPLWYRRLDESNQTLGPRQ